MDAPRMIDALRRGEKPVFPKDASQLKFAEDLDNDASLVNFRSEFVIPTKAQLKRKTLTDSLELATDNSGECVYFCGNSLGLPPKATAQYLNAYLTTWGSIAVNGHFNSFEDSPLAPFQDMAQVCADKMAPLVGASPEEVVVMNTLTVNLHLMMASFYKPTEKRHKILLEWRPFPSDWYAIESHIEWHGRKPEESMLTIGPDEGSLLISTKRILDLIDEHHEEIALVLLPGIQYYSGQLLDIPTITAHAKKYGLTVGWDLAHAAGNVELKLHDWDVDFACWCTYKYMNAGAGAIAAAYVHEKHGYVEKDPNGGKPKFHFRLTGWYSGDKSVRFLMDNKFLPTKGAGGFQLSNPSMIDLTSLAGSLSVFEKTSMKELRDRSLLLTAYAEYLLDHIASKAGGESPFKIISPLAPLERGAQLSVLLKPGLLERVQPALEAAGIICDKRKPDVIRVAPAPLYNSFADVWNFMQVLEQTVLGQSAGQSARL